MSINAKYRQLHRLASGGMAELFLAEGAQGQRVVVKRIRPPFDRDASYRALFADEGTICAALDSPHIVRLIERGEDEDGPFLVFEYIEGTDLGHVMDAHFARREPLELAQVCAVLQPLLRALVFAHEAKDDQGNAVGLVHRDISPGNVLLSEQGDVYLADFGVAFSYTKTEHTVAGELKGKFAYMSPEQTQALAVDARSDLFSLGILAWEMLTGVPLFDGPTDVDVAQAVRSYVPPEAGQINPLVPAKLSEWIAALLSKDVEQRPANAREALEKLESVLEEQCLETGLRRHAQHLARVYPRPRITEETLGEEQRRRTQRVFRPEGGKARRASKISLKKALVAAISAASLAGIGWGFFGDNTSPLSNLSTPTSMQDTQPPSSNPVMEKKSREREPSAVLSANPPSIAPAMGNQTPASNPPAEIAGLNATTSGVSSSTADKRDAKVESGTGAEATPESTATPQNVRDARKSKPARIVEAQRQNLTRKQQIEKPILKSPRELPLLAAQDSSTAVVQNQGFGMLFLETEPWAYVSIDGAPLGSHTPLLGLRLPAGTHQLELKNPVLGLQKSLKVEIRAGEDARHFLDLTSR